MTSGTTESSSKSRLTGRLMLRAGCEQQLQCPHHEVMTRSPRTGAWSLALAEEDGLVPGGCARRPVSKQFPRIGSDSVPVTRSPEFYFAADIVDQRVRLATLTCDVEIECRLIEVLPFLGCWDRDERLTRTPPLQRLACGSVLAKREMSLRRLIGRIENRIG